MTLHERMYGLAGHASLYRGVIGTLATPMYRRIARDVRGLGLGDGSRVLDAGTGPGRLPLAIARRVRGVRIDGIDLSPAMVDFARGEAAKKGLDGRITFTTADVVDLPFADGTFDLVVSSLSMHHWSDPAGGLRELCRVVRPGGQIWIYDVRKVLRQADRHGRIERGGLLGKLVVSGAERIGSHDSGIQ